MVKKPIFQKLDRSGYVTLICTAAVMLLLIILCATPRGDSVSARPDALTEKKDKQTETYINSYDLPVKSETTTNTKATEAKSQKRYELTEAERWEVASVVTAEAGGEPFEGKIAVAQCILQACEDEGIRPSEVFIEYQYCDARPEPYDEVLEAVEAVFDDGQVATAEPIKYFYAPALTYSEWHESQVYVMTISGHRFFKEATING